mgnify:FL=1
MTHGVVSVDGEVASVDVVSLEDHLEHLRLVDSAFLHKVDDLILLNDGMLCVVVKLALDLILELTALLQELLVLNRISEVLVIFSEQVGLIDVGPGVVSVSHGVLSPDTDVLATSQQEKLVNFPIKVLPVQGVG